MGTGARRRARHKVGLRIKERFWIRRINKNPLAGKSVIGDFFESLRIKPEQNNRKRKRRNRYPL